MTNDGKELERLVTFVEQVVTPIGLTMVPNRKVYEDGVQVAELDLLIRGRFGTTDLDWLIECRDRPSEGRQGSGWIQQLYGRKAQFDCNQVTAVSTTGFTRAAEIAAEKLKVELREVKELAPSEFAQILPQVSVGRLDRHVELYEHGFNVQVAAGSPEHLALQAATASKTGQDPILRSTSTGETVSALKAFQLMADQHKMYDRAAIGGPPLRVDVVSTYSDGDHFVIDTTAGPIRVHSIKFVADLTLRLVDIPQAGGAEYLKLPDQSPLAKVAKYELEADGHRVNLDLRQVAGVDDVFISAKVTPLNQI